MSFIYEALINVLVHSAKHNQVSSCSIPVTGAAHCMYIDWKYRYNRPNTCIYVILQSSETETRGSFK